ncbi:NAD(P)/FAD-dependent oxidoreductase [Nocardioides mangrovicus]|uniref:NAD(P)/FAD-dependent oxidoreductase n=1 Tax=Nocardioides mangrovicus TaxID=2478913 RepID=A0A3L8P828_9ACTN|nr:NAD(P)/FAD-dependent oxidoreductase [Nocardioides mangrovicus]RLV51132.1 NAD(P)/FAD-dependent oxidoreductase [Nocardioides mangrovicus]
MDHDVIVIGGGAAGLSGALMLGRSRRDVLVLDAGEQRNRSAEGVHGFVTRDGLPPAELVRIGTEEVAGYGVQMRPATATSARAVDGGFEVSLAVGGAVTARRLLVTTGAVDELPDVPGLREQWGRHVVHCPYCHGWEVRDEPIAVLATGPAAAHQALLFSQLSDRVSLLTDGHDVADLDLVRAAGVRVVEGQVARILAEGSQLTGVEVAGSVLPVTTVAVASKVVARSTVLEALGAETADLEMGGQLVARHVVADPVTRETSVPGVYAAGNVAEPMAQVVGAAAAGAMAGAVINMALVQEDVRAAVGA